MLLPDPEDFARFDQLTFLSLPQSSNANDANPYLNLNELEVDAAVWEDDAWFEAPLSSPQQPDQVVPDEEHDDEVYKINEQSMDSLSWLEVIWN